MNGGLPELFEEYLADGCDRLAFLQEYLSKRGVSTSVVTVGERRHLYVNFPSTSYNPLFKIKTVITHYDRVPRSPGANDNSAANFQIADFAVRLQHASERGAAHNVRIFFTDGEEIGENGVSGQGAFALAELFKKLGIANDDVYVFDACGRGEVAVLARAGLSVAKGAFSAGLKSGLKGGQNGALKGDRISFQKRFTSLFERTESLLRTASPSSWMTLPVPYSDNAGFLACGIPAVAITLLPKEEATDYLRNLMSDKNLEKEVMNCRRDDDCPPRFIYEEKMPVTWRLFHTEYDNALSLTPSSWDVMRKILDTLASSRQMA